MRILVLTTSFPRWNGDDAGVFVERMVLALAGAGVSSTVVVPADTADRDRSADGLRVRRFRYWLTHPVLAFGAGIVPNIRRRPSAVLQIPGLMFGFISSGVRSAPFDLIHAQWLIAAVPGAVCGYLTRRPLVVTARGADTKLLRNSVVRAILRTALRRAARITAVSNSIAEELTARLPELRDRISVIENGVTFEAPSNNESAEFAEAFSLKKDSRYVVFTGSVIPRKRVHLLAAAMAALRAPDVTLLICGRLDDAEYVRTVRSSIASYGGEPRVRLLGPIPPGDVSKLLCLASVYVSASEHEGRPNGVLEAMAAGVPCVLSDIPPHRELAEGGSAVVVAEDPASIAREIDRLMADPELCRSVAAAAAQRIERSSWNECAAAYCDLFGHVLNLRR